MHTNVKSQPFLFPWVCIIKKILVGRVVGLDCFPSLMSYYYYQLEGIVKFMLGYFDSISSSVLNFHLRCCCRCYLRSFSFPLVQCNAMNAMCGHHSQQKNTFAVYNQWTSPFHWYNHSKCVNQVWSSRTRSGEYLPPPVFSWAAVISIMEGYFGVIASLHC